MSGEYDVLQNISFEVIIFAFSRYYNNKPYLSDIDFNTEGNNESFAFENGDLFFLCIIVV